MEGDTTNGSNFNRICVFCGSNSGNRQVFSDAALDLGDELVKRKIELVYGGGSVGLMGLISQRVYDGGCHVLGVIPKALVPTEISGETVGEVRIVADMHERKAEMARESDAFIALPGGYGTMEETLEMITWTQLGIHKKPVGLLNVDGYYNSLLALFDNGVEEGFIKPSARQIVLSAVTAKELFAKMEVYDDDIVLYAAKLYSMERKLGINTPAMSVFLWQDVFDDSVSQSDRMPTIGRKRGLWKDEVYMSGIPYPILRNIVLAKITGPGRPRK